MNKYIDAEKLKELIESLQQEPAELSEEDERIRKWLYDYFSAIGEKKENWLHREFTCEQILAYLEKQKDIESKYAGMVVVSQEEWDEAIAYAFKLGKEEGEKQKEQKPFNDTQEYLKGVARVQDYDELTKFEKVFDRIADTYAHRKNKDGYNEPWYTKERAAEMLYHAKEELGLRLKQNPAEWSEEDEKMLKRVLNSYACYEAGIQCKEHLSDYHIEVLHECAEEKIWLKGRFKSLHSLPHSVSVENATKFGNLEYERGVKDGIQSEKSRQWKPSEEQMEALMYATGEGGTYNKDALKSLLDDLKKRR